jgi:general secretion pathway protein K
VSRLPPERERGAALLAVLLLVAIMGAIAAAAFEKLRLSTALAVNHASLDQARAYAVGLETLLAVRVDDLVAESPEFTTLAGGWNGARRPVALPGEGSAEGTIRDGGNCFNLNSLVAGDPAAGLKASPSGIAQFVGLMRLLQIPDPAAHRIAAGAADWADSDSQPQPDGAEDASYAGAERPYRPGNTLFAEASELRAVAGMTADVYARLRPFLCALPAAEASPINANTLLPGQEALLAMIEPDRIGLETARAILARRPEEGWRSVDEIWGRADGRAGSAPLDPLGQLQLSTRWFALELRVEFNGAELIETALVDARFAPSRVALRRWGRED